MTKNITAVLFALLLSSAAFAQYWGPHPCLTYHPNNPNPNRSFGDTVRGVKKMTTLDEEQKIAEAFADYNGNVPNAVKTRGLMESPNGFLCVWGIECLTSDKDIPAVFLPNRNPQYYTVAFPANRLNVGKFTLKHSLYRIENKESFSSEREFISASAAGQCPAGMTARRATNANEADLCLLTEPVKTAYKENFKKLFQNNRVTIEMAAKALKRK